ncbi:hypothetical protein CHCC15292_3434 [Bacillus licheniformis]|nr:hypothetical protein CHCC20442_3979 [Bacillus licheniformis]TWL82442.1 hypothetical protein CHCC15292_3434 [Bacillus licheniformis]
MLPRFHTILKSKKPAEACLCRLFFLAGTLQNVSAEMEGGMEKTKEDVIWQTKPQEK